jgi:Zn-dependent protease
MLRYLIVNGGSGSSAYIVSFLLCLPVMFLSLSLHETAHGFAAYKLGDPTAKNLGRLTLNPFKHLDPIGFLCMMLAGFGWAKPVPINSRNFKKPRRDIAISSIAGPVSNLLLAFVFAIAYRIVDEPLARIIYTADTISGGTAGRLAMYALTIIFLAIRLNINLAVFNLLPIPPLDGSKILYMFLPPKVYFKIAPYERYISIGFMLLLVTGVIYPVIETVSGYIATFMFKLVGLI